MYKQNCVDFSGKKYNETWEKEFKWLTIKDKKAYCKLCSCFLSKFKKHNFQVHERTKLHKKSVVKNSALSKITKQVGFQKTFESSCKSRSVNKPIKRERRSLFFTPELLKECEIKLCVSIACHTSMREVNHVSEIIKSYGYSELGNLKLHRTKCSNIVKNVINVAILEEIVEDLKDSKYSLLICSWDISAAKYLCICVKYFSKRHDNLRSEFLGLLSIVSLLDEYIFNTISSYLMSYNVDLRNCVGLSYDGVDVDAINNSLVSHFHKVYPNILFVKCVSHCFELCCENAMKQLPSHIEFLLGEVSRWFKFTSPQEEFHSLFEAINASCIKPSDPITSNNTGLALRGKCISAVVDHWHELKAYFNIIADKEQNFYASLINEMLSDGKNYLYFTFILPVIQEFENINSSLQKIDADVIKVFKELDQLHKTLLRKIFKRSDRRSKNALIKNFVLGVKFQKELQKTNLSEIDQNEVTERYFKFLVEANKQLENQLSQTVYYVLNLKVFHPQEFLNQTNALQEISKSLYQITRDANIQNLESRYNQILQINWEGFPDKEISSDPIKFWAFLRRYETSSGEKSFETLAETVLSAFTIPFHKAVVECVFTHMLDIKNKLRNRTSIHTLEAILRIRTFLHSKGECCQDLTVTPRMLSLFSHKMYQIGTNNKEDANIVYSFPSDSLWNPSSYNTSDLSCNIPSTSTYNDIVTHTVNSDNLNMPIISYSTSEEIICREDDLKVIYAIL